MNAIHTHSSTLFKCNIAHTAIHLAAPYLTTLSSLPAQFFSAVAGAVAAIGIECIKMANMHQMTKAVFPNNRALHVATYPSVQTTMNILVTAGLMSAVENNAPNTANGLSVLYAAYQGIGAMTLANAARKLSFNEAVGTTKGPMLLANLAFQTFQIYQTCNLPATLRDSFEQAQKGPIPDLIKSLQETRAETLELMQVIENVNSLLENGQKGAISALKSANGIREHLLRHELQGQFEKLTAEMQKLQRLEEDFKSLPELQKLFENLLKIVAFEHGGLSRLLELDDAQLLAEMQKKFAMASTDPMNARALNATRNHLEL